MILSPYRPIVVCFPVVEFFFIIQIRFEAEIRLATLDEPGAWRGLIRIRL